jgi:hypothetical protein
MICPVVANSPTYTATLEPGVAITCVLTSSVACPSANPVTSNALTVLPSPDVSLASNSPVCEGEVLTMTANGGSAYLWQGPGGFTSTQSTVSISNANLSAAGVYSVTVTDMQGCTDSEMAQVVINVLPDVAFAPGCLPDTVYDSAAAFPLDCGVPPGGTYQCDSDSCGTFSPMTAGWGEHEITYTYKDANGCTASVVTTIFVTMSVATEENEIKIRVTIFPNPSTGLLNLHAEGSNGPARLEVLNVFGQVVDSRSLQIDPVFRSELDLSSLPKGAYLIRFQGDTQTVVRSISIQ